MKVPSGDHLSCHHPKVLQGLDEGDQRYRKGRLGLEQTAVSCPVWDGGVSWEDPEPCSLTAFFIFMSAQQVTEPHSLPMSSDKPMASTYNNVM